MSVSDALDTTQNGEASVLRKLLGQLPPATGWIVEFGAWDGLYLSNSYPFVKIDGWSAVLIEGDSAKFAELEANWRHEARVHTVNAMVGWNGNTALDAILDRTPIPAEFDVLSIDIDGNDYHVWEAVAGHRPRIVVIEFNHTIPNEVDFVQEPNPDLNHGSSLRALVRLGRSKGYALATTTRFNAFFVEERFAPSVVVTDNSIDALHADRSAITYLFSGYDGQIFLRGNMRLPWHNVELEESRLQVLPLALRKFPQNYSRPRLALFYVFKAWRQVKADPKRGLRRIGEWLTTRRHS